MKYQSSSALMRQHRQQRLHVVLLIGVFVLLVGTIYGFTRIGLHSGKSAKSESAVTTPMIERTRISRMAIPESRLGEIGYGKMFADLNDIQIEAAMKNGISNPEKVADPSSCKELVKIGSNDLIYVDDMSHSKPYLVPEAALMLEYIGERFSEILKEQHKDDHDYRPIVTSALRSQSDVDRLRRRNRNASENSCHRYGTTIDITYIRFLRDDGEIVNEEWLKRTLGEALYELRYEGICYVKHERRQGCFHITVRNTEYKGNQPCEIKKYTPIESVGHEMKAFRYFKRHVSPNKSKTRKNYNNYVEY